MTPESRPVDYTCELAQYANRTSRLPGCTQLNSPVIMSFRDKTQKAFDSWDSAAKILKSLRRIIRESLEATRVVAL